jgi:selenocysteine-specific elongation factor
VIRNAQATATIGGGMVLDPFGPARKRRSSTRLAWLQAMAEFIESGDSGTLLARSPLGLRASALVRLSQLPAAELDIPASTLRLPLQGGDELLLAAAEADHLEQQILLRWPPSTKKRPTMLAPNCGA